MIKKTSIVPVVVALLALSLGFGDGATAGSWNDIAWYEDADGYREALAEASDTGKPILVYFYATWCGYCRQLNTELLAAPEVLEEFDELVAVRVNAENGPDERSLAGSYGVRGYPALFVRSSDPDGAARPLRRTVAEGGRPRLKTPQEFAATLRAVR